MHHIKRIFVVGFLCLMASQAATAQTRDGDSARLVGRWLEYAPGENLVNFTADGRVSMYLRTGEIADHLDGKWTLAKDGTVTMTFSLDGKSFSQSGVVSFVGEDMVLADDKGTKTRHRRHTGPLPAWTQW